MERVKRRFPRRTARAAVLAGVTLWFCAVTAGSESIESAAEALGRTLALPHAGRVSESVSLSPAVSLALSQVPSLRARWGVLGEAAAPEEQPGGQETSAGRRENAPSGQTEPGAGQPAETAQPTEEAPGAEQAPKTEGSAEEARSPAAREAPEEATRPGPEARNPADREAPEESSAPADNGSIPKTLLPGGTEGYTVCGRVYIKNYTAHTLSPESLREPFDAELTGEGPQILILHSHGSEGYTPAPGTEVVWSGDCRTTDSRYNVLRAGDAMAEVFEAAGVGVIHDRTLYDYPNYTGSYDRSLQGIRGWLERCPSIRIILDVHRDAIEDSQGRQYKVIAPAGDRGTAAQLALVMGSDGSGLDHPRWLENLRLAAAVQEQALGAYPELMRPITLRNSRYNQHASTGSLLVEVGAAGNSPEEAQLAARLFAETLLEVLESRSK